MGKTIYKYRYFCTSENMFKTVWSDTKPTKCSESADHLIDIDSITIIDQVSQNTIQIQNDPNNTKGHYMLDGVILNVPSHSNYQYAISYPFSISCCSVYCYPTQSNLGDSVDCYFSFPGIHPSSNISIGQSNIYVSQQFSVVADRGFDIMMTNSSNMQSLGRIIDINENVSTSTLTTEFAASNVFLSNDDLYMRVYFVRNLHFPVQSKYVIGQGTLNGTYIPSHTPIYIDYKNNDSKAKQMTFHIEYTY